LAGARTVHTVDINRHLNAEMTFRMVRGLERHLDRIAERSSDRVYERFTRLATARGIDDLLGRADIVYSAPLDATRLSGIPDHSLDIVFSNSVMEHIPAPVIGSLMRESHRVLKDDGLAVHAVGCNDHYAFFDRRISFVNFLRYSEREWAVWNNTLASQNRLRAPDFIQLARGAGFAIVHERRAVRPGTREALQQMTIAPEFHRYDSEDLVATSVDFVARKTR
jgi:SAM-dependent methyltransferase